MTASEDIYRILDANANRAREALRVMEEYVRFIQNDPAGNALVKQCRHDFAEAMKQLDPDTLLASRNTPGDVGTSIKTLAETQRASPEQVFTANAKRLTEALRALEEYGKLVSPEAARYFERLRYRAYEIEQHVRMRGERSARFAGVRLYVILTESLCSGGWLDTAEAAIAGGAGCLQLREKQLEDGDLLDRARRLSRLCRDRNVLFIVNDRPDIARRCDADGVHLGQTDMSVADARRVLGPDRLIGVSTHTPDQFDRALTPSPDYIAVGPMFPSETKPQDHVPGPELLAHAVARTDTPIVCIGGITENRIETLIEHGGSCVCVCSAIIADNHPEQATRALISRMNRSPDRESTVS